MDAVPLRPDDSQVSSPAHPPHEPVAGFPPPNIRLVKNDEPETRAAQWESLNAEGTQDFLAGRFAGAQSSFEAALDAAREFASNDLRLATSLNNLGETYRTLGQFDRAQPLLEEALSQRERVLGPRHPHVARSRNNLGYLHECRGEYFEAFEQYREAFAAMGRPPAQYPIELTSTLMHLARLAAVCRAHEHALRFHQAACAVMGTCVDEQDPEAGLHLHISGQIHEYGGRPREAWQCYRSALRVLAEALGSDHHLIASVLAGMGRTLRSRGHEAAAERVLQRSLTIFESAFESPHHEIAGVLNSLGELYRTTGRGGLAELLYRRSLRMVEATLGEMHPDVAAVLYNLSMVCEERGERDAAGELMAEVDRIDGAIQLPPTAAFERVNTAMIGR